MPHIDIVGLGPGESGQLTLKTRDLLLSGVPVYLRTLRHPTVAALKEWGCVYTSFDALYDQAQDFASLYQQIAQQLIAEAQAHGRIVYAVPGHPLVAETTVQTLLEEAPKAGVATRLHAAVSCLEAVFEALQLDPTNGLQILDALTLEQEHLNLWVPMVITQVYAPHIASDVKITLLERLDPEHPIQVIQAAGTADLQIHAIPLYQLDRLKTIDHLTTVYVPAAGEAARSPLSHFRQVVAKLRDPDGGCPWDLKQTPHTLRRYILEEAYEAVEAIEQDDPDAICEELGDLLLQVFLQAQVADDQGDFDLDDVAQGICEKMIRRHLHVFGDATASTPEQVRAQWEDLKALEKAHHPSVLSDVPKGLPALSQSEKIQHKTAQVGFDWPDSKGVLAKISEELQELKMAHDQDDHPALVHELGDLFFVLVNFARWNKIDPEDALRSANKRFTRRFQHMESVLGERPLREVSLTEWESLWQTAKQTVG